MKQKLNVLAALLLIILFSTCTKEKYSGQFTLGDELKNLLPIDSTFIYSSSDSVLNSMTLSYTDNYYFKDTWDSDDGGVATIIEYTGEFETLIKYYTSNLFDINYKIFVDKYGDLQQDVLDITIESNLFVGSTDIHIEMPLDYEREKGYNPNIDFADSLMVHNVKLFDVYFVESGGLLYYLQEDKGLVAFEFDDNFWML